MMKPHRKKKINSLASFVSEDYLQGALVDLLGIARYEEVPVHYDHYEKNTFDGMLVYYDSKFHIHINLDRGNTDCSRRGRFTLAHELGHYLIDEHRIALKYGMITPHQSKNGLLNKDLIELEADYFAGCLLMPERLFKDACARKEFSFKLVNELSNIFRASLMAVIFRFIEIGSREFMVIVSKGAIVRWFSKSHDFAKIGFRFKVGSHLPIGVVSNTYSNVLDRDFESSVEELDTNYWFYNTYYDNTLFEQCYYSQVNGYLITLLWFK